MKKEKLGLGLLLFLIGLVGIFSILGMDIPIPEEVKPLLDGKITPEQFKWLALINPTILLLVSVVVGTLVYRPVGLTIPLIEGMLNAEKRNFQTGSIVKFGVIAGIVSGVLLSLVGWIFIPHLPADFIEMGKKLAPPLATRFLYGGLTEEILMRFGLMSLMVWLLSKVTNGLSPTIYWIGIFISALGFAAGHLPLAFNLTGEPTTALLVYILTGNSIGGIIFGWLYWKKGLESAMIAHIFTHIIMVLAERLFA